MIPVPPGWGHAVDPCSKKIYYFNGDTQVTQWQPPMPMGWRQIKDPISGNFYYYNQTTLHVQWEMPMVEEAITVRTAESPMPPHVAADERDGGIIWRWAHQPQEKEEADEHEQAEEIQQEEDEVASQQDPTGTQTGTGEGKPPISGDSIRPPETVNSAGATETKSDKEREDNVHRIRGGGGPWNGCHLCGQIDHKPNRCPRIKCHQCNNYGHKRKDCPNNHPKKDKEKPQKCDICHKWGHVAENCTEAENNEKHRRPRPRPEEVWDEPPLQKLDVKNKTMTDVFLESVIETRDSSSSHPAMAENVMKKVIEHCQQTEKDDAIEGLRIWNENKSTLDKSSDKVNKGASRFQVRKTPNNAQKICDGRKHNWTTRNTLRSCGGERYRREGAHVLPEDGGSIHKRQYPLE